MYKRQMVLSAAFTGSVQIPHRSAVPIVHVNASHKVVDTRQNRNGFFANIFVQIGLTCLLYTSVQNRLDRVLGLPRENLTGVRVVRAFDKEKSEVERFENANDLLTRCLLYTSRCV